MKRVIIKRPKQTPSEFDIWAMRLINREIRKAEFTSSHIIFTFSSGDRLTVTIRENENALDLMFYREKVFADERAAAIVEAAAKGYIIEPVNT